MQKGFTKVKRSSSKLIGQLMSKLRMVKQRTLFDTLIDEENVTSDNKLQSKNSDSVAVSSKNIPIFCEHLEKFINEIKTSTNYEYLVYDYPVLLEHRLKDNIEELECILREIKNAYDNIQKQKMQQKSVEKEKISLTRTLKKLKDIEIREMETIVSLFDNGMFIRWQGIKLTRKTDVLERFLSDIKSKQLALENLNTLVTRRLTSLKMFSTSTTNETRRKFFPKPIPLPFSPVESTDSSTILQSQLSSQLNSIFPVPSQTPRSRRGQIEERRIVIQKSK